MNKQLDIGIKVESEHEETYNKLFLMASNGKFPTKKQFFKMIALDHLKENPKYYTYLKKMEKEMNE